MFTLEWRPPCGEHLLVSAVMSLLIPPIDHPPTHPPKSMERVCNVLNMVDNDIGIFNNKACSSHLEHQRTLMRLKSHSGGTGQKIKWYLFLLQNLVLKEP